MMKTNLLYLKIGIPLLLFSFSAMAADEDEKIYPGAFCQPETSTLSVFRDSVGRMFNNSTEAQNWTCPIVRDQVLTEIEYAEIVVRDHNNNNDNDVSCQLFSRGPLPTENLVASPSKKTFFAPGKQTLAYGIGDPNVSAADRGFYYFRCSIPGTSGGLRSGVVAYHIYENP